jgi:hypothetical protein
VGLLDAPRNGYDRFRLYPILDAGEWQVQAGLHTLRFSHRLAGWYTYEKTVALTGEASFEIRHCLTALRPLAGEVYNHNFFTIGKLETGQSRRIDFPFRPEGVWRTEYDSVGFSERGIRFSRALCKGESVYNCGIHEAGKSGMPYDMTLSEGPLSIHIHGDAPVTHTVFWANHRVACLEPYVKLIAAPGEKMRWSIMYEINLCHEN